MAFKKKKQMESKIEKEIEHKSPESIPEIVKQEVNVKGYKLVKDFTKSLKKGAVISEDKYNELKSRGIDIDSLVE